ncbi:pyridoxal kinase [Synchytrium endobioticum]|nr:pyridoxal kinase [Synchytrium endobioticum]
MSADRLSANGGKTYGLQLRSQADVPVPLTSASASFDSYTSSNQIRDISTHAAALATTAQNPTTTHGMLLSRRVLSVQSHVVYGYVGNKAATFPLNLHGFHVDCIHTVLFSNHTGYPTVKGDRLDGDSLRAITRGLKANGMLHSYSHILAGYIGQETALEAVAELVEWLKHTNKDTLLLLDPVMGDEGKLYVPQGSVRIYKERLLNLADILTPNAYEAELLSGIKITDMRSAIQCLDWLHHHSSANYIVITSLDLTLPHLSDDTTHLHLVASYKQHQRVQRFTISFPKLALANGAFTGTGDLFAAMLLAHLPLSATLQDFVTACEKATATLQGVLKTTMDNFNRARKAELDDIQLIRARELAVISSKHHIENPEIVYRAQLMK